MACFFPFVSTNRPLGIVDVCGKRMDTVSFSLPSQCTDTVVSEKYLGMLSGGMLYVLRRPHKAAILRIRVRGDFGVAGMWGDDKLVVGDDSKRVVVYDLSAQGKATDITDKVPDVMKIVGHNGNVVMSGKQASYILARGEKGIYRVGEGKRIVGVGHGWYAVGFPSRVVLHTQQRTIETRFVGNLELFPVWVDFCDAGIIGIFSPMTLGATGKNAVIVWNEKEVIGLAVEMDSVQIVAGEGRFFALSSSTLMEWDREGLVYVGPLSSLGTSRANRQRGVHWKAHEMIRGESVYPDLLSGPHAPLFTLGKAPGIKDWLAFIREERSIEMYVNDTKIAP